MQCHCSTCKTNRTHELVSVFRALHSRREVLEYQRLQGEVHELVGWIFGRNFMLYVGTPLSHEELLLSQGHKFAIARTPRNFDTSRRSEGPSQIIVKQCFAGRATFSSSSPQMTSRQPKKDWRVHSRRIGERWTTVLTAFTSFQYIMKCDVDIHKDLFAIGVLAGFQANPSEKGVRSARYVRCFLNLRRCMRCAFARTASCSSSPAEFGSSESSGT